MENGAVAFFQLQNLLTYQNVLVIVAVWFLITSMRKAFPDFFTSKLGKRILPFLPILLCEVAIWSTAVFQPASTWAEKTLLGIVLGALTANVHTLAKRLGLQELIPGLREGDRGI